ncbi:MAG: Hsp20/alpha crystallin family protein [Polyangiaceae bacterium]|nr:Hsp20/alpha crystallin family protein [Polyangiaceae bacterium]
MATTQGEKQITTAGQKPPSTNKPVETGKQTGIQRDAARASPLARYPELTSPFGWMGRFMGEMDRIFESLGMGGLTLATTELGAPPWNPRIETFVRDNNLVIRADLPGIPQDQISVQVEDDILTISGERHDDRTEQREGYWHSERSYGHFRRSIPLPEGVDSTAIQASFEDGVLQVTAPLPEKKLAGRTIPIGKQLQSGQPGPTAKGN